jgi:hypothetical protein
MSVGLSPPNNVRTGSVDLDEILYECDVIVGDFDAITFNPIASTILK